MIALHTWNTPTGQQPAILREELGLPYASERFLPQVLRPVDVLEARLAQHRYLAGRDHSIAGTMGFPLIHGGFGYLEHPAADCLPILTAMRRLADAAAMKAA